MAFTADSKLGDILKERPKAQEMLAKYAGGMAASSSMLAMAQGMTIRQIAGYLRLDQAKIDQVVKELNAL